MAFISKLFKQESETVSYLSKEEIARAKEELLQMGLDMISTNMAAIITSVDREAGAEHDRKVAELKADMLKLSAKIEASEDALKKDHCLTTIKIIKKSMAVGACLVGVGIAIGYRLRTT